MEENIQESVQQEERLSKVITTVKQLARSKYGVLGIIISVILIMVGSIIILPNANKTPPQNTLTQGYQGSRPTSKPAEITPTQAVATPSSMVTTTEVPTVVPTIDPTASWSAYTNSLFGYTIKYPPDWRVQDLGALEPKVPSYIAFNQNTATTSARSITISVSTRTYSEQLTIGGNSGTFVTVDSITGTKQSLQDSDGLKSISVILPRTENLLILHTKTIYVTIFDQMLSTLKSTK